LLIIIYRSPLLAITPLLIAGIVYGVVDRVIGLVGKYEWFVIEGQAVSIMLVLLFAVITDYSLFIFSRYREELRLRESKFDAMGEAIHHVSEPIFFSGGTVFLAMLTLFVTVFKPYNHFAPVFSIAVVFILLAGLTLIPAIFALMGRRAFWPFIPKQDAADVKENKKGFWRHVGNIVEKRPGMIAVIVLVVFGIGAMNMLTMNFSFNMLKSFPEDMSSRQGFETLEEEYPPGQLAPMDIVLTSEEPFDFDEELRANIEKVITQIEQTSGIDTVSPHLTDEMIDGTEDLPDDFVSESGKSVRMQVIIDGNPYEKDALATVESIREQEKDMLTNYHFSPEVYALHIAGQTAEQLDVKQMNKRDMILLFSLVTVLLTLILGFQTKSVRMPILMMGTILLSYGASLGIGWFMFKTFFGFDSFSYRLPVYTFVFMVALGIDYNIMLVSRVKELAQSMPWKQAVGEGIALTGGVISSAGLILAATFSVLITQPLQELYLFGSIMALGILLDTFIIRGFLLPSLLIVTHREKIE
ncbi:MAG TPA: MMPL family transporter, partial [Bacillota bacterium]|nr:MMPL family transporter [Bacillota bacterium]